MKRTVVRYSRLTGGGLLVLFGVISGFLPVLQGWMFILAGLAIMAPESARAQRALDWVKARVQRNQASSAEPAPVPIEGSAERIKQGPTGGSADRVVGAKGGESHHEQ